MRRIIRRGDIFYANLNPVIGSEQGGKRPVLIIQNNIGNRFSPTVIVTALSAKTITKTCLPTHYILEAGQGIDRESVILLEQIRTIDKSRLLMYLGSLDRRQMAEVNRCLAISVGICRNQGNNRLYSK